MGLFPPREGMAGGQVPPMTVWPLHLGGVPQEPILSPLSFQSQEGRAWNTRRPASPGALYCRPHRLEGNG